MAWRGSISGSLLAAARSYSPRSQHAVRRLPCPPVAGPRLQRRRLPLSPPRSLGELGCAQSFLPLYSVVAAPRLTSHLSVSARACCELSQGVRPSSEEDLNSDFVPEGIRIAAWLVNEGFLIGVV